MHLDPDSVRCQIEGEPGDWVLVIQGVAAGRYRYRNDALNKRPDYPIVLVPGAGARSGLPKGG